MPITGAQPAKMYSQVKVARVGATRVGYASGLVFVNIGGAFPCVLYDSLTITDELDETPNRATFTVKDTMPAQGSAVRITRGSKNTVAPLFAGHVLSSTQEHRAQFPDLLLGHVNAVDYTWQLGFQKVTAKYQNTSATTIAKNLIDTYAVVNGFTNTNVVQNLPAVDEITFTNEDLPDALTRLARRIGAYWFVDYAKDLHFFFEDTGNPPADLTPTHRSLSALSFERDRTQALSRVYVEGRGSRLLATVNAGDSRLPLEAVDMFTVSSDVFLKASYQGADGGAKHLDFSGIVTGGGGSIVGPGIGPTTGPTLSVSAGAGVTAGQHWYGVTYTTASGESLPGPTPAITTGVLPDPTVKPGPLTQTPTADVNGSTIPIGRTCRFSYTYSTQVSAAGLPTSPQTLPSLPSDPITTISNKDPLNPGMSAPISIPVPYSTDARVKWILIWANEPTVTGAGYYLFINAIPNNPAGGTTYQSSRGSSIAAVYPAPTSNATAANVVNLSNIPIGAAAVTGRKLYRTSAGGGPLKLLTTLANNTATTYTDTTADASLGANAPSTDTSGLKQPEGQVLPGATSIPVAGTSAFESGGGWAIIGNGDQVIRYASVTASTLAGIPASGEGSITATVIYNSTVTAAPMLTGIPASGARSITRALVSGDEIYLVVQCDNAAAQSILAAMGGNGIREEWIQDRRLSIQEARARGLATLQLRPADELRCSYVCRDPRTASGKTITINLPAPFSLNTSLKIQSVTISKFRSHPSQMPTYAAQASSQRHSFDDLLRRARYKE